MRKISVLLFVLFALSACTACQKQAASFQAPASLEPFSRHIEEHFADSTFVSLSEEEIRFTLNIDPDEYQQASVFLSTGGATIDEVGFFLADEEQIAALVQKLETYLAEFKAGKREWLRSYNPSEAQKLENGKLLRYGNCLVYGFLSQENMRSLEAYVESCLYR